MKIIQDIKKIQMSLVINTKKEIQIRDQIQTFFYLNLQNNF